MEIIKGKKSTPYSVVIYGQEGVGKTTLASQFPAPLFLDVEGSTARMDVARLPVPATWSEALQILNRLTVSPPEGYRTLVIDSWDWLLSLLTEHVISLAPPDRNGEKTLDGFGYGRGYDRLAEHVSKFFNALNELRDSTGMHIVLVAHAVIRKFELPEEQGTYDRWELKIEQRPKQGNNPLSQTKEWADLLLFCRFKTLVSATTTGKSKACGQRRVMHTQHNAAWDAKNRDGLPDELPLAFESIAHLFDAKPTVKESLTVDAAPPAEATPAHIRDLDRLLAGAGMTGADMMMVISRKGVYPADMPYTDMAPEFIKEKVIPYFHTIEARHKEMKGKDQ